MATLRADAAGRAPRSRPGFVASHFRLAAAVGLAVGGFTACAQGWLSNDPASLANSAAPWAMAGFAVARTARSVAAAAVTSWIVLTSCELGYVVATELRGGSNSSQTVVFWLTGALIAGPVLGIAAHWSRTGREVQRGLGNGVIAGVLCGEGVYGLTTVAATTSSTYWTFEIIAGVAVLATAMWRCRSILASAAIVVMMTASGAVVCVAARQL